MRVLGVGDAHRDPIHVLARLRDEEAPHLEAIPLPAQVQRASTSGGPTGEHARARGGGVASDAQRRLARVHRVPRQRQDERQGVGPHAAVEQRQAHAHREGQGGVHANLPLPLLDHLRLGLC